MFSQSHVVAVNNNHDENSDIEKSSPSVSSLAILTAVTCASSTPTSLATVFGNGGMTATTPTLTPTTMKNIEEALQGHEEELNLPRPPIDHRHQGGFVPPTVDMSGVFTSISRSPPQLHLLHPSTMVVEQENVSNNFFRHNMPNGSNSVIVGHGAANEGGATSYSMSDDSSQDQDSDSFSNGEEGFSQEMDSNDSQQMSTLSSLSTSSNTASPRHTKRTKTASKSKGRKGSTNSRNRDPNEKVTPEEELRRKLRRERNKLAAARCRKRRVDQTNRLLQETEKLEEETRRLKKELQDYERKYVELEQFLNHHECRFANVKNNNINYNENRTSPHQQLSQQDNQNNNFICGNNPVNNSKRPPRPSSLALGSAKRSVNSRTSNNSSSSSSSLPPTSQNGDSLVTISTPSNGIFSLEGLEMTGLTPLLSTPSAGGFLSTPVSCGGQTRGDIPLSPDGVASNKLVSL